MRFPDPRGTREEGVGLPGGPAEEAHVPAEKELGEPDAAEPVPQVRPVPAVVLLPGEPMKKTL